MAQADSPPEANPALESAPDLEDIEAPPRCRCCLDLQGWIQVLAGIVIGLIAKLDVILFSSAINSSPPPSTPHKPET